MKKVYSVTNFSEGINEYSPQGASDIKNFNITNDGVMETRRGWEISKTFSGTLDAGSPLQTFFANGKLFLQTTKGLYYSSGGLWPVVTNKTSETGAPYAGYFAARLKVVVADNNRTFLASTNANLWLDTGSSATPELYEWGFDAPDLSAMTPSFTAGSGGLGEGKYAYAFSYEGLFGAMSPLTARSVQTAGSNGTYSWGFPSASSLDGQIQKAIIYRTEKVSAVTFDEGSDYEKVHAGNAPLKRVGEWARASMGVTDFDDTAKTPFIGLAPLAGQLEGAAKPPNYLTNITLYGGRIWGSVGASASGDTSDYASDRLVFSALDETAAPLYDIFPGTDAAIPHIVNVRDRVTGIGASRDYLAVFSKNSIQLVRGQGVISGIYGKQQPGTDLDLSQYLTLMGAKDDWCVAESLGNVYFYSSHDKRVYRIDRDGNVAWISQPVQGLLDSLEEPADSVINQVVAHEGSIYVARRVSGDVTLLQFDELRNQWTSHNFGSLAHMTSFVSNHRQESSWDLGLYAVRDNDNQIIRVSPYDGSSQDNGANITASYTSQEFAFTKPTRLDAVRIGTEQEQSPDDETGVTLNLNVDGRELDPIANKTLSKSNNFTIRTFQRGYKHKVGFTLSGAQTVRFFELQFRSR